MARLDVLGTAWNGYRFAFGSLRGILRLCWPWLALGSLLAAAGIAARPGLALLPAVPYAIGASILWIATLRIALLAEPPGRDGALRFGGRELRTLGIFAAAYLASAAPFAVQQAIGGPGGLGAAVALSACGLYLAVRMLPASAAIAIDQPVPSALRPAWRMTRGNGLRLVATLALAHLPLQLAAGAVAHMAGWPGVLPGGPGSAPAAPDGLLALASPLALGLALGFVFFVQVALAAACLGLACQALVPTSLRGAPAANAASS
ncbi:hypothetical protein [Arenibaculum pallidiluteum]|uniref:hypothetical protein n=1 Tax=Arenibaculum pallidiluteum TaxID=2812559 RepID=UPI001A963E5B|nr:hypothetical protein [Arenibaculum pallidiluteum]